MPEASGSEEEKGFVARYPKNTRGGKGGRKKNKKAAVVVVRAGYKFLFIVGRGEGRGGGGYFLDPWARRPNKGVLFDSAFMFNKYKGECVHRFLSTYWIAFQRRPPIHAYYWLCLGIPSRREHSTGGPLP